MPVVMKISLFWDIHRAADRFLAFPISYFPVCSTTKIIFLGLVKEVITTEP
jgi:hypothetical protein